MTGGKLRQWMRRGAVDFLLLSGAAGCFLAFGEGARDYRRQAGISEEVGRVMAGAGIVRRQEGADSAELAPGSALLNQDTIWVRAGGSLTLQLEDKTTVRLAEKTLIILKRRFKDHLKSFSATNIVVVKGSYQDAGGHESPRKVNSFVELPKPTAETGGKNQAAKNRPEVGLHPLTGSTIYAWPRHRLEVPLSWPQPVTGQVVVINQKSQAVDYLPVVRSDRAALAVAQRDLSFRWQVINDAKEVVYGPYEFSVNALDEKTARSLIGAPGSEKSEIIWDP